MPEKFYQNRLYPFQDEILRLVQSLNVDFYLTGGTALSRHYLQHRYSDDLDFFVNNHPDFKNQCKRIIDLLKQSKQKFEITTTADTFLRIMIENGQILLKVDFVNDVPFHYGGFEQSKIYNRVDNWRNILSNKICALSRYEPKDIIDIIFIARRYSFNWENIFEEAREKDLWAEPLKICKIIKEMPHGSLQKIKWISAINEDRLFNDINNLHNDIFYGNMNLLYTKEAK